MTLRASQRAIAPGADEFLPAVSRPWLPPSAFAPRKARLGGTGERL